MLSAGTRVARGVLFILHQYQALCVAVSLSHLSLNAVALYARPCWAVWGLTVQEQLTQTCDITIKVEYIYF